MEVFGMGSCIGEKAILEIPKYWFRKVGDHPVFDQLAEVTGGAYEDPFEFVDECSRAVRKKNSDAYQSCMLAQWAEWQALMVHCMDSVVSL